MITLFEMFVEKGVFVEKGDYVIFMTTDQLWSDWYGIIIESKGQDHGYGEGKVYLVKLLNELDERMKKFIKKNNDSFGNPIDNKNFYVWSPIEAFDKYEKKAFDMKVEQIEIEKKAKKFGI